MRAISLWQPWASAMISGAKRNETRSWRMPDRYVGQQIAIHAAKTQAPLEIMDADYLVAAGVDPVLALKLAQPQSELAFGAILGVAVFAASRRTETFTPEEMIEWRVKAVINGKTYGLPEGDLGNYEPGRWAWPSEKVIKLTEPIPWKGSQGFFEVPDELIQEALRGGE